ncbi:MAG: hypothetical protein AB7E79_06235 [Rhodospirillaceae bacterium]
MRHEKNISNALMPLAQTHPPLVEHGDFTSEADLPVVRGPAPSDTVDVCAQLFKFCKQCDEKYLRPRKIQCLFDVDSGAMHRAALQLVCEVIETLLIDIADHGTCHSNGASLTVTLRRQHGVWILAVTERRISALRHTATVRRLSLVRRRAQLLGAACRVHQTNEGFITALMFDCAAVASGWEATSSTLH